MFEIEFDGIKWLIEPDSLLTDELNLVALDLGWYALHTAIEPGVEVKAAAIALRIIQRHPRYSDLRLADVIDCPEAERQPLPEELVA